MRKKVAREIGRAARAVGKNKGKAGLAAAGVALVAGAVVLARKRRSRRARNDGLGDLVSDVQQADAPNVSDSAEAALHIPVAVDADMPGAEVPRQTMRRGAMKDAPVLGARFNNVREDRKGARE